MSDETLYAVAYPYEPVGLYEELITNDFSIRSYDYYVAAYDRKYNWLYFTINANFSSIEDIISETLQLPIMGHEHDEDEHAKYNFVLTESESVIFTPAMTCGRDIVEISDDMRIESSEFVAIAKYKKAKLKAIANYYSIKKRGKQ